jgi:hypothetical protein
LVSPPLRIPNPTQTNPNILLKTTYPLKKSNKYFNYLVFVGNLRVKDVCVVAFVMVVGVH